MKRLFLIAALASVTANLSAQTRLVLYEEFTGENCPSCSSTNPALDAMMASGTNATKIHMIKYMCDIPSAGPFFYMTNTLFEATRQSYYSVPFAPFGTIDGFVPDASTSYPGYPAYLTQSDLDAGTAIAAPFKITATYKYNSTHDTVTITAKVKAIAAYAPTGGSIKLRSALCKTLHFATSPGSNGETEFINTVRGMYPDAGGLSIANTWAIGDSQTYVLKGAVISETSSAIPHTATDTSVAVWVQNDADKKIAQTGIATRTFPAAVNDIERNITACSIFPNPTRDNFTLGFNASKAANATISIFDAVGKRMNRMESLHINEGSNTVTLNTDMLSAGIYNVQLQIEDAVENTLLTVIK